MTCLSFDPDAAPLGVAHAAITKCVWPVKVDGASNGPSALARRQTRTEWSREAVKTAPSAVHETARTSCSCPDSVADSVNFSSTTSMGSTLAIFGAACCSVPSRL